MLEKEATLIKATLVEGSKTSSQTENNKVPDNKKKLALNFMSYCHKNAMENDIYLPSLSGHV